MGFLDNIESGSQIDYYRIESPVARSGMASIFRAIDTRDNRQVALKIPHPDMEADPILSDRFQREAGIGEKLNHPKVMRVYGGEKRSRIYMVMEWCEGRLLRQIMDEGRISPDRAIRIATEVLDALDYIHSNGVVHRDLKPENIMVDEEDNIKLIDFGIAGDSAARRLTYANFTATLGTPNYISPEQVQGKRGDGRSDIYAAGVILRDANRQASLLRPHAHGSDERPAVELPLAAQRCRPFSFAAVAGGSLPGAGARPQEPLPQGAGFRARPGAPGRSGRGGPCGASRLAEAQVAAFAEDPLLWRAGPDSGGGPADDDPAFPSPLTLLVISPSN